MTPTPSSARTPLLIAALALLALPAACSSSANVSGVDGNADFTYGACFLSDCALSSRGIASGATATLRVRTQTPVRRAASGDSAILSVGAVTDAGAGSYDVTVGGGTPGVATFTVYDASDHPIDHVTVTVAATASVAVDDGVRAGVSVLIGQPFALHATSLGGRGETLAGTGAIRFEYAGAVRHDTSFSLCLGDCAQFRADAPGEGTVVLAAVGATRTVAVQALAPSAIDAVTFAAPKLELAVGSTAELEYTLSSAGGMVHGRGLECVGAAPSVATFTDDGPLALGMASTGRLSIAGVSSGTTSIACSANGHTASVDVRVK